MTGEGGQVRSKEEEEKSESEIPNPCLPTCLAEAEAGAMDGWKHHKERKGGGVLAY